MALALNDRVQQTGTANTTVSFTLTDAVTGFQSFAVVGNGNTTYYAATDASGNWEVGVGTYSTTGPTLTRTTILSSSNSGSAVTFSGTATVYVTYPSGKSVNLDASSNVSALGTVSSGIWQGTAVGLGYGGTGQATANASFNALAPSQSANSGKYLTTDGTNASWASVVAGASITNDTTTSTNVYPLFAAATSGTPTTIYTGNTKYLYKPSTGELTVPAPIASNGIVVNSKTVGVSYTIASGNSAMSAGPITLSSGVAVTIASGSRWVVL